MTTDKSTPCQHSNTTAFSLENAVPAQVCAGCKLVSIDGGLTWEKPAQLLPQEEIVGVETPLDRQVRRHYGARLPYHLRSRDVIRFSILRGGA